MTGPHTPASATAQTEPDRWLVPVRRGVLLAGSALSLRLFLLVVWSVLGRSPLAAGVGFEAAKLRVAGELGTDLVLTLVIIAGGFLLTHHAVPGVSARRWALRTLVLADAALAGARLVIFLTTGALEPSVIETLVPVATGVALLLRLGALCDVSGERLASTWTQTAAWGLLATGFAMSVTTLLGANTAGTLLIAWALALLGIGGITMFATVRAARWL